jgi:hypothetical protein
MGGEPSRDGASVIALMTGSCIGIGVCRPNVPLGTGAP